MRRAALLAGLVVAVAVPLAGRAAAATGCAADWPMYGHDLAHTFQQQCTSISAADVATLHPVWHLHTPDAVTASPAVVDGVLYDGDWSGTVYAIDAASGRILWTRVLNDGEKVSYGRITSSPTVATLGGRRLLLIASGATLYALEPRSGAVLAAQSLDPRTGAELRSGAPVEIESSPAVWGGVVYVGLDENETPDNGRAGLVALSLGHGRFEPLWKFDPELGRVYTGPGLLTADPNPATDFGCGDVWTSPAIDPRAGLVLFATANCQQPDRAQAAGQLWSEAMFAVRLTDGQPVWKFQPAATLAEAWADDDFGASPSLLSTAGGGRLVGEGQKSAMYWARDRASGAAAWSTLAGQPGHLSEGGPGSGGFAIGGFIGSSAVQTTAAGIALRVVGGTAVPVPDASDPASLDRTTWAVRGLDAATGKLLWTHRLGGPVYGATSIAGGVAFVPDTFSDTLQALDAATGLPLWAFPLDGPPSSTPVVVGGSLYLGTGTGAQGPNGNPLAGASGIWAFSTL